MVRSILQIVSSAQCSYYVLLVPCLSNKIVAFENPLCLHLSVFSSAPQGVCHAMQALVWHRFPGYGGESMQLLTSLRIPNVVLMGQRGNRRRRPVPSVSDTKPLTLKCMQPHPTLPPTGGCAHQARAGYLPGRKFSYLAKLASNMGLFFTFLGVFIITLV